MIRVLLFFAVLVLHASGIEGKIAPNFGESITWEIKGEEPSLSDLEGKSVLVLFFQSWCGICNGWSGQMMKQAEEAYNENPEVVIVALKTDGGSPKDARKYISDRTPALNWLVGVDEEAEYYNLLTEQGGLFTYVWIKPDGSVGELRKMGRFYGGEQKKSFSMSSAKYVKKYMEEAKLLFPDAEGYDEELQTAVAMAEKGLFISALKSLGSSRSPDAVAIKSAIAARVENSIAELVTTMDSTSDPYDRYVAYLGLEGYAKKYGSSSVNKEARAAISKAKFESWARSEERASKSYKNLIRAHGKIENEKDRERFTKTAKDFIDKNPETYHATAVEAMLK